MELSKRLQIVLEQTDSVLLLLELAYQICNVNTGYSLGFAMSPGM